MILDNVDLKKVPCEFKNWWRLLEKRVANESWKTILHWNDDQDYWFAIKGAIGGLESIGNEK